MKNNAEITRLQQLEVEYLTNLARKNDLFLIQPTQALLGNILQNIRTNKNTYQIILFYRTYIEFLSNLAQSPEQYQILRENFLNYTKPLKRSLFYTQPKYNLSADCFRLFILSSCVMLIAASLIPVYLLFGPVALSAGFSILGAAILLAGVSYIGSKLMERWEYNSQKESPAYQEFIDILNTLGKQPIILEDISKDTKEVEINFEDEWRSTKSPSSMC